MGIAALIPARGGSKGVPRKNVRSIGGHPLIAYSIMACRLSEQIEQVFVSTDDSEIATTARNYGAIVPFLRPAEYATDSSGDQEVIKHFFENIEVDVVAYMRPTTPMRDPERVSEYINYFCHNKDKMSGLRSMQELAEPPYKMLKIEHGYCAGFFEDFQGIKDYVNLPRQVFPQAYYPNGYIDVAKRDTVMNSSSAFGMKIMPVVTPSVVEIDTQEDVDRLEYQIANHQHRSLIENCLRYRKSQSD
jgi:CMP-N,N'-diacetyllegionaminic acid synthase